MPNGFDPVWMETVRIEIDRDRLRPRASQRYSRGGEGLDGIDDGGGTDVPPSDFSIVVWNLVQEQERSQRDKVWMLGLQPRPLVHL